MHAWPQSGKVIYNKGSWSSAGRISIVGEINRLVDGESVKRFNVWWIDDGI